MRSRSAGNRICLVDTTTMTGSVAWANQFLLLRKYFVNAMQRNIIRANLHSTAIQCLYRYSSARCIIPLVSATTHYRGCPGSTCIAVCGLDSVLSLCISLLGQGLDRY